MKRASKTPVPLAISAGAVLGTAGAERPRTP